jgi:hypothetical protein
VRLDRGVAANYVCRSVSGRLQIDGVVRSGSGPTNHTGSTGELSGSFADVRTNTVSGDLTVLRRSAPPTGASAQEPSSQEEPIRDAPDQSGEELS